MNALLKVFREQVAADMRSGPERLRRRLDGRGRVDRCTSVAELREVARRRVPRAVFDFADGAANDEATARTNQRDLAELALRPRVLIDVETVDTAVTVLGRRLPSPIVGAPTGLTGLLHPGGELAIAQELHARGSLYVLSAMASYTVEEVVAAAPGPLWFQLYMWRDRGLVEDVVARAAAAGCEALVLTVDVPRAGHRERDSRNGFGIPPRLTARTVAGALAHPAWTRGFVADPRIEVAHVVSSKRRHGAASLAQYINGQFDPTLSWGDIAWLRERWPGHLVIKGILRAEDAALAVDAGASAVVVSNHGGRQLDQAMSTIRALPAVVDEVGDRAEVLLDGGVRRGSDVLKALALGARACLAGRALVYGLAAGGRHGVGRALDLLGDELQLAMALSGTPAIGDVTPELLDPSTKTVLHKFQ